jgi:hypothetical protein
MHLEADDLPVAEGPDVRPPPVDPRTAALASGANSKRHDHGVAGIAKPLSL